MNCNRNVFDKFILIVFSFYANSKFKIFFPSGYRIMSKKLKIILEVKNK